MASYVQKLMILLAKTFHLLTLEEITRQEPTKTEDVVPQTTASAETPATINVLNSLNTVKEVQERSDIVVVGGGIHSLIFAIHARTLELKKDNTGKYPSNTNRHS